ncbi:MAG TPA: LTA synthase family protein [Bacillales bacterium]|nr:LTA synthase family protein [Bacillales bacterium]
MGQFILWMNPISSVLLLLGMSFFFGNRVRPGWVLIISFLSTMLLFADLLYYRFYIDFITIPVITQLPSVGGLGQSTVALMSPFDLFLFLDLIFLLWWLKAGTWTETQVTRKTKLSVAAVAVLLLAANVGLVKVEHPQMFEAFYNRKSIVKAFGAFNYHAYDIVAQAKPVAARAFASNSELEQIEQYVNEHEIPPNQDLFGAAKGKNIILISLESTQNFVIGQKINGEEVTPFLNDLVKNSYYFDHFYHQTEQGKTSDAEFLIDSSLYPLPSGSVFVRYPENEYNALPEILGDHGYYSAVFHGNERTFWNRDEMYDSLGYDHFFSQRDYHLTDENTINYGLKDIPFFKQSMPYLKDLQQPFYSKFLLLSNHFPFLIDPEDRMIEPPHTDFEIVNNYFMTVRYEDEAVKKFFQMLKESGLYKNSVIILYGDHYGISEAYEKGLEKVFNEELSPVEKVKLQRVPFIIHFPGQTDGKTIHTVAGQVDIRPTILHLLGIRTDDFLHFGHGLFSPQKEDFVIFRNGSFVTENYIWSGNRCYSKSDGKKVSKAKCEPWFERRSRELELSDMILYEDLLRFK